MRNGRLVAILVTFLVAVGALWGFIGLAGLSPQLGLDLRGGVSITLIPATGQGTVDTEVLDQTVQVIRNRVDGLGVAEPDIARQGETILVQLPGVEDQEQAQEVIGRTAQLQFRPVTGILAPGDPEYDATECANPSAGPPAPDVDAVVCGTDETDLAPEDLESLPESLTATLGQQLKYQVGPVAVPGDQVTDARAVLDQGGTGYQVDLELDDEGAAAFAEVTGQLACAGEGTPQRQLAIVLDGVVESAPPMSQGVECGTGIPDGTAVITTGGGEESARELALVLRAGALPIQLDLATSQAVSPTLGRSSLDAGLLAGTVGLLLVGAYMIFLYRGIGIAAVLELAMFGIITTGLIVVLGEYVGFTLTLAGISGVIVSIGIAADSSIIYRERYRDEIRAGRTVRTAADHAFSNAFRTNLTGNTVSFLAAVVLYLIAVGPVRGFAFTLGLSTLVDTLIFATFTRSVFGLVARSPKLATSRWVGLRSDVIASDAAPRGARPATGGST